MIDAGRPPLFADGLALLRDHADPALLHVLPGPPRLRRGADGAPRLRLDVYRSERADGGLLQLEVDLGIEPERLEELTRSLTASLGVAVRLAVPAWRAGEAALIGAWRPADAPPADTPPTSNGALRVAVTAPSLEGDCPVVIAAALDRTAAALAAEALRAGTLPMGVVYTLEVLALEGPLAVEAEAELHRVHERLRLRGGFETAWGSAELQGFFEELVEEGLIRFHVHDEVPDADAARAEALRRVGEDLLRRMFDPGPGPSWGSPDRSRSGVGQLSFYARTDRATLEETARWSWSERRARVLVHHTGASLVGLLRPDEPAPVTEHTLRATGAGLRIHVEAGMEELGLAAVEVLVQWGPAPTEPDDAAPLAERTVLLRPDAADADLLVEAPPLTPWRWRATPHGGGSSTPTPWQAGSGGALVVTPRRIAPFREAWILPGDIPFDWLDRVELEARAGDHARHVTLRRGDPAVRLRFPGDTPDPRLRATWRGRPGEPDHVDADGPLADLLVLDAPFGPDLVVTLVPAVGADVVSLEAEATRDGPLPDTRRARWDAPPFDAVPLSLRRLRGADDAWRLTWREERETGELVEHTSTPDTRAAVLGAPGTRIEWLDVALVADAELLGVALTVTATDGSPPARVFLGPGERDRRVPLVLGVGAPLRWSAAIERWTASGATRDVIEGEGRIVVIS